MDAVETPYDTVLYPSHPLPQTHPDRLATIAGHYGVAPAPATRCRVLELGCGVGGNLAAMAYQHPGSEFVGIDLSGRSIAIGRQNVAELGLANVRLEHCGIDEITPDFGTFDYIVAHGVYSWVPAAVREKMWEIFARNLAPQGVAYVSYNALPGSRFRDAARDIMLYHVRAMSDPAEKIREGRAIVGLIAALVPQEEGYARVLAEQLDRLNGMSDEVVFHDDLDAGATAFLFHDVVAEAGRHGLQYLSEARFAQSHLGLMPGYVARLLDRFPPDAALEREQYLDFLACRSFRQTLLCHAAVALDRTVGPDCVRLHYLAGHLVPEEGVADPAGAGAARYRTTRGVALVADRPLVKAAALVLGERWPEAVAFGDLVAAAAARLPGGAAPSEAEVDALAAALFRAYAAEQVDMHLYPPRLTKAVTERPEASLIARQLSESGSVIVNLRHARVTIEDDVARRFLRLLDGTRDRAALMTDLADALAASPSAGAAAPTITAEGVERNLALLASLGLLVAPA
ncbi:MAG TPA: class I SAM-dependent methyltransferase [Hyphomicrobiales bacterium]|nr:class I SAM-dependent methyltransferase [Hyphomicrobiales bacterium]